MMCQMLLFLFYKQKTLQTLKEHELFLGYRMIIVGKPWGGGVKDEKPRRDR